MVKIRLRRMGAKKAPYYRVVVADSRYPRDGRFIEEIGYYDPKHSDEKIDVERADYWIANGAQMSDTVKSILARAKAGKSKVKGVPDAKPRKKNFKKGADEAAS